MTTEPRTEAGRALLDEFCEVGDSWAVTPDSVHRLSLRLLAIEAEAARLALEDVAERVRGLPKFALVDAPGLDFVLAEDVLTLLSTKEEGS